MYVNPQVMIWQLFKAKYKFQKLQEQFHAISFFRSSLPPRAFHLILLTIIPSSVYMSNSEGDVQQLPVKQYPELICLFVEYVSQISVMLSFTVTKVITMQITGEGR